MKKKLQDFCGFGVYIAIIIGLILDFAWFFGKVIVSHFALDAFIIAGILFSFHLFFLRPSPWFPNWLDETKKEGETQNI